MTGIAAGARPITALRLDNAYARLPDAFRAAVTPTPLPDAALLHANEQVAALLDLDPASLRQPEFLAIASGTHPLPGGAPVAQRYAGHQFGTYVPELGDGRAILLGQVVGRDDAPWDLHLKGAGPTPFARGFDGRSVLRSAVREYLVGEALHHLGVPTTRALCLVASTEPVQRETTERAASLIRVAPTHVRFGTFESFAWRREHDHLARLADHVIERHFPELVGAPDRHARLLEAAAVRTAVMVAGWQATGFVHGVMNTDNMSILGVTLDFGPYAFMEAFVPGWAPNHSDPWGRYAWDQQPGVAQWNVSALANAMLPLVGRDAGQAALDRFAPAFEKALMRRMRAKLGLQREQSGDEALLDELLALLAADRADWTLAWRTLGGVTLEGECDTRGFAALFPSRERCAAWLAGYRARLRAEGGDDGARRARMDAANPRVVLRTHLAQRAVDAAERGDAGELGALLEVLRRPFDEPDDVARWALPAPDAAGAVSLSCSS